MHCYQTGCIFCFCVLFLFVCFGYQQGRHAKDVSWNIYWQESIATARTTRQRRAMKYIWTGITLFSSSLLFVCNERQEIHRTIATKTRAECRDSNYTLEKTSPYRTNQCVKYLIYCFEIKRIHCEFSSCIEKTFSDIPWRRYTYRTLWHSNKTYSK